MVGSTPGTARIWSIDMRKRGCYFANVFRLCYWSSPWGTYSGCTSRCPGIYTDRPVDSLCCGSNRSKSGTVYRYWDCSSPIYSLHQLVPLPAYRYFEIWSPSKSTPSLPLQFPSTSISPCQSWPWCLFPRDTLLPARALSTAICYWWVSFRARVLLYRFWRCRWVSRMLSWVDRWDFSHRGRWRYWWIWAHWWRCDSRLSWNRTILEIESRLLRWWCRSRECCPIAPSNIYFNY